MFFWRTSEMAVKVEEISLSDFFLIKRL